MVDVYKWIVISGSAALGIKGDEWEAPHVCSFGRQVLEFAHSFLLRLEIALSKSGLMFSLLIAISILDSRFTFPSNHY
jgi:hypothetical protein